MNAAATECAPTSRWLPFGAPAASVRLYCLPHAGGSASVYRSWSGRVEGVAVCPLQPPGRDTRLQDPLHYRMGPMVREIAEVLLARDDVPYAIYGHSLGALVGFEVIREIRRRGGPEPVHLFASGAPAPDYIDPAGTEDVRHMSDPQVVELLQRLGGTPSWMLADETVLEMILPPVRADFSVKETYRYEHEPPLSTPITAIAGTRDLRAGPGAMVGWRRQTTSRFRTHTLAGGHFAVLEQATVTQAILSEALATAASAQATGSWSGGVR